MKSRLKLTIVLFCLSFLCSAQNSNEIGIYLGPVGSDLIRMTTLDGGASYHNDVSYEFGARYLRDIGDKLSIETGISIFQATVEVSSIFSSSNRTEYDLTLVSIPIWLNYQIANKFYVNGGPTLDFQTKDYFSDSQSGIGFSIGLGRRFTLGRLVLNFNPMIDYHAVLPFEKENNQQRLLEIGVLIGMGYQF